MNLSCYLLKYNFHRHYYSSDDDNRTQCPISGGNILIESRLATLATQLRLCGSVRREVSFGPKSDCFIGQKDRLLFH